MYGAILPFPYTSSCLITHKFNFIFTLDDDDVDDDGDNDSSSFLKVADNNCKFIKNNNSVLDLFTCRTQRPNTE
jgi:hypothetical protein